MIIVEGFVVLFENQAYCFYPSRLIQANKQKKAILARMDKKKEVGKKMNGDKTLEDEDDKEVVEDATITSSESDREADMGHFDSILNMSKPRGLVDGLSRFFTPSNKRKSRVSLSSVDNFTAVVKAHIKPKKFDGSQSTANSSQQSVTPSVKQSDNSLAHRGRKKTDGPPGSGQLKGLFDGLSHIFVAQGERKRSFPVYNPLMLKRKAKYLKQKSSSDGTSISSRVPNGVCSSSGDETRTSRQMFSSVLVESDCDADGEDEGEDEDERNYSAVKVRPSRGQGSEDKESLDDLESDDQDKDDADNVLAGTAGRLAEGRGCSQSRVQDEGKIILS